MRARQDSGEARRRLLRGVLILGSLLAAGLGANLARSAGTPAYIIMARPSDPEMPAVRFPHWKHQQENKCFVCHPALFSRFEKAVFDHDDMGAGRYCGACHDGKKAFDPQGDDTECEVCHVEE